MSRSIRSRVKPLLIVTALFVGSAAIRLSIAVGAAQAEENAVEKKAAITTVQTESTDQLQGRSPSRVLEEVLKREAIVNKKEKELLEREAILQDFEKKINEKLVELDQAESELRSTIEFAETAAETDLQLLTQVYENMKPKEAVELFEEMEAGFSAGFLARMRPEVSAQILSGLSPNKAYSISAILAGKNADLPAIGGIENPTMAVNE